MQNFKINSNTLMLDYKCLFSGTGIATVVIGKYQLERLFIVEG